MQQVQARVVEGPYRGVRLCRQNEPISRMVERRRGSVNCFLSIEAMSIIYSGLCIWKTYPVRVGYPPLFFCFFSFFPESQHTKVPVRSGVKDCLSIRRIAELNRRKFELYLLYVSTFLKAAFVKGCPTEGDVRYSRLPSQKTIRLSF